MDIDPTTVRLSDSLLLSDFMGCDSVYRHGYFNRFTEEDLPKLNEAFLLAQTIEHLQKTLGPCSISYGYISPELSQKVVKYQNPNKPSYHRWDLGAAADLCFHSQKQAPIKTAFKIDDLVDYSRMITYAESSQICVATRVSELGDKPRRAFYENRYIGQREPKHIKYSANKERRGAQKIAHTLEFDWQGGGHPSYHGGGIQQLQHLRAGTYSLWTDFLYYAPYVGEGVRNSPLPLPPSRYHAIESGMEKAGKLISSLVTQFSARFSVVRGLVLTDNSSNWEDEGVSIVIVPPASLPPTEVVKAIELFDWKVDHIKHTGNTIARIRCHAV